jgi:hypothetical protein
MHAASACRASLAEKASAADKCVDASMVSMAAANHCQPLQKRTFREFMRCKNLFKGEGEGEGEGDSCVAFRVIASKVLPS